MGKESRHKIITMMTVLITAVVGDLLYAKQEVPDTSSYQKRTTMAKIDNHYLLRDRVYLIHCACTHTHIHTHTHMPFIKLINMCFFYVWTIPYHNRKFFQFIILSD